MRNQPTTLSLLALLFAATVLASGVSTAAAAEPAPAKKSGKVLRHVVLFKFKDSAKPEDIKKVEEAFAALPGKIPTIIDFEWGTDVSEENKSAGFTHCFFVTFADEKGRATYLPHGAHKAFIEVVGPVIDKVLVVDYWTK